MTNSRHFHVRAFQGDSVVARCEPGYRIDEDNCDDSFVVRCGLNGLIETTEETYMCAVRKSCSVSHLLDNAASGRGVTDATTFSIGVNRSVSLACNPGYWIYEEANSRPYTDRTARCMDTCLLSRSYDDFNCMKVMFHRLWPVAMVFDAYYYLLLCNSGAHAHA
jgi:hypothetical protein